MRGNGLSAADYAPVAELERSVAADVLLALREVGVAAYAVPPRSEHDLHVTVFADRTALRRARAVVHDLAPDAVPPTETSPDLEIAWQQIVSGFSSTAAEPRHEPEEDHFVPEPPPAPPRPDRISRLAWGGVFGGPLLLLAAALVSWSPPRLLSLLCVLGFVGGMLTLVLRMKDRPPTDDGPDDGAVV